MKFPAKTHEERCMVLDNMPRQALVATIKDHVFRENGHHDTRQPDEPDHIPWLQSLVDGRLLCIDDVTWKACASGMGLNHPDNDVRFQMRQERWEAFLSLLWKPMFHNLAHDPVHGHLKRQPLVATMGVSEPFEQVFRQAMVQLLQDDANLLALGSQDHDSPPVIKNRHGMSQTQWEARNDLMCKALSMVCALGQADLVAPFVNRSTAFLEPRMTLDLHEWNNHIRHGIDNIRQTVSPLFFAIQFSQTEALEALVASGMSPSATVMADKAKGSGTKKRYDLQTVWMELIPSCSPSALESVLKMGCQSNGVDQPLAKVLETCTDPQSKFHDLSFYLQAFMAEGYMDLGRTAAEMDERQTQSAAIHIQNACLHGFREVIDHFKGRIPWGRLAPALSDEAIANFEHGGRVPGDGDLVFKVCEKQLLHKSPPNVTEALTRLLEHALADRNQDIFEPFSVNNDHNAEPVQIMIDADLKDPMLVFLKSGLDINDPMCTGGRTPLQHAVAQGKNDIVHMMRSFTARNSLHSILDDIDIEMKAPRP